MNHFAVINYLIIFRNTRILTGNMVKYSALNASITNKLLVINVDD